MYSETPEFEQPVVPVFGAIGRSHTKGILCTLVHVYTDETPINTRSLYLHSGIPPFLGQWGTGIMFGWDPLELLLKLFTAVKWRPCKTRASVSLCRCGSWVSPKYCLWEIGVGFGKKEQARMRHLNTLYVQNITMELMDEARYA